MLATGNMFPSIYPIHGSYWHFDAKNDVCIYPIRSMVLVENANMTGFFVDGIHGTAYIPAPLGSVMSIIYYNYYTYVIIYIWEYLELSSIYGNTYYILIIYTNYNSSI